VRNSRNNARTAGSRVAMVAACGRRASVPRRTAPAGPGVDWRYACSRRI
jgi:hypothetical protein